MGSIFSICSQYPAAFVAPQQAAYEVPENGGPVQVCVQATNVGGGFSINYNTEPRSPVEAEGGKTSVLNAHTLYAHMFKNA